MDDRPAAPAEPLLEVDDICTWLKVSRHWVYDEVESRRLPHVRLGKRSLRFRRTDIQAYVDQRTRTLTQTARETDLDFGRADQDLEALD